MDKLIVPTIGRWDKGALEGLFLEVDVKRILKTSLPPRGEGGLHDRLIWHLFS